MTNIPKSSLSLRTRTWLRTTSFLLAAGSATGCVASKQYDEARSVAESEQQAHARTRERLEASMKRISDLEAALATREEALAKDANLAEESKLASAVATKEKDAAVQLVEQLRSELARTGDHLVLFAREKRDLQQTLLVAEERMRDIEAANRNLGELVAASRDLSLALGGELDKHVVELGAKDGQVVLGMTSDRLFAANGDALVMDAGPVLAAVGKVSAAHPSLRVVVREPANAPLSTARMTRLGDGLRQNGVADARLSLPAARFEQPAPAPVADPAAAPEGAPSAPVAGTAPAENQPSQPSSPAAFAPATGNYEIAFAP
ncbi:MAG TPA: hypothetical protein VFV94_15905 [Polyangiaceae bacterium]|jgi:hypothetical protein|nr:hypothetical protein [Polyangiaceae bacterium]